MPASSRPVVVQTEHLDPEPAKWLADRAELVVIPWEDSARLAAALPRADALLIRTYTRVNDALLDSAPRLRVVARAGVGLDNVDLDACQRRGITVLSTPGANTRAVVELVTAFMLDALRPRVFLDKPLEPAAWNAARKDLVASRQLSDLTLGVIGLGRVGTGVARVGRAFDMTVLYHDLIDIDDANPARRAGAVPASFNEVLAKADVLTLHPDGRASNKHLINDAALAHCKPDVVLINTSRGFVLDAHALADFLIKHKAAQALLDVHDPEPIPATYPLLDLPNAHLSPHIAAGTKTAHANMSWVVRDLWNALTDASSVSPR
jgi:phosphoglycerate dehydrogenase-like enzyme